MILAHIFRRYGLKTSILWPLQILFWSKLKKTKQTEKNIDKSFPILYKAVFHL